MTIYNCPQVNTPPRITQHTVALFLKPFNCKTIPDPDEFWVCFWELIRGHYVLQKKLGITHGDISIHNMIIQRAPVRKVALIDFDLSEVAREDAPSSGWRKHQRTGTKPFMSGHLLSTLDIDTPRARTYRGDLESFCYCLLWLILKDGFPADARVGRHTEMHMKRGLLIDAVIGSRDALYPCPALWPGFDQFRAVVESWYNLTLSLQSRRVFAKVAKSEQTLIKGLIDALKDAKQYPLDDSMSWAE
ncbi:hypothetical protein CYLTODRAFT_456183 [Cylindrobasidium torrendii FP15055 ss-10]|uniref:Protein kinase domain-containing protein n=1 Tax=Cylindrobasidium torrendii FP15055 ss-10 TaxID=1314674 RepID=A0A0D7B4W4_9AGAR|nr:hypothetical protein CYLTODRAFT_456183 [Cylindrobasidium torrendii FP15055 ss-10]